ncbi:hypothetical protein [Streptomyces sp. NPDC005784]|uniref:hypothetical protein n=1 Tax=Streptomyces sp. NPDC005784 TaxID=3364731 RepID=UPI0036CD9374
MTDAKIQKARAAAEKAQQELAALEAEESARAAQIAAERDGRAREYALGVKANWLAEANANEKAEREARARLVALLSEEPWFAAFIEFQAHAYKTRHIVDTASRAKHHLGENAEISHNIAYVNSIVEVFDLVTEQRAREIAAEFADGLDAKREAYVNGGEA